MMGLSPISSCHKFVLISTIVLANISWGWLICAPDPVYPRLAEERHIAPSMYGLILGVSSIASCVASPLFGRYAPSLGVKTTALVGFFFFGVFSIAFGMMGFIRDGNLLFGLSFLNRICAGLVEVSCWGLLNILMGYFPEHKSLLVGIAEVGVSTGRSLGAVASLSLYSAGGFLWSQAIPGIAAVSISFLLFCVIPGEVNDKTVMEDDNEKASVTFRDYLLILKNFSTALPVLDNGLYFSAASFLLRFLEPMMRHRGLTEVEIQSGYMVFGISSIVSKGVAGYVGDLLLARGRGLSPIVLTANVLGCVGFAIIAATYSFVALEKHHNLLFFLGVASVGLAEGIVMISSFVKTQEAAYQIGLPRDLATSVLVSGTWTTFFFLGLFIGPTLGGVLISCYGFQTPAIIASVLSAILFALNMLEVLTTTTNMRNRAVTNQEDYRPLNGNDSANGAANDVSNGAANGGVCRQS